MLLAVPAFVKKQISETTNLTDVAGFCSSLAEAPSLMRACEISRIINANCTTRRCRRPSVPHKGSLASIPLTTQSQCCLVSQHSRQYLGLYAPEG